MGYRVFSVADREKWVEREGLEGPFFYSNGRVLYYDPAQGQYWDPLTDFYVDDAEMQLLRRAC